MKTNFKLVAVAVVTVGSLASGNGLSLAAGPVVPQNGAAQILQVTGAQFVPEASLYWSAQDMPESGATQIIRVAGVQNVPEAALYLDGSMTQDTRLSLKVEAAPALHERESGAAQIVRAAGAQFVPEASLFWNERSAQESGATQIIRIAGAQNVPEASLYWNEVQH